MSEEEKKIISLLPITFKIIYKHFILKGAKSLPQPTNQCL